MKKWFSAENVPSRKKRFGESRREKKSKTASSESDRYTLLRISVLLVVILLVTGGSIGGEILRKYLLNHSHYMLHHVEIHVDDENNNNVVDWIRELLGLEEGTSLFSIDIDDKRSEFMKKAPSIKSMAITRELPDTIRVDVVERVAVASLGSNTGLVADREGYVFAESRGGSKLQLPRVVAYREGGVSEGSVVQGITLAAIQVAACYDVAGVDVEIVEIDASREDYVYALTGQGKNIKLAWKGMGLPGHEGRENLETRMLSVSKILHSPAGADMMELDATVSTDRIIGNPGE